MRKIKGKNEDTFNFPQTEDKCEIFPQQVERIVTPGCICRTVLQNAQKRLIIAKN